MVDQKSQRKSFDRIIDQPSEKEYDELKPYLTKKEKEFIKGQPEETPSKSFLQELKKEKKQKVKKMTIEIEEDIYKEILKLATQTKLSQKYIVNKALRTVLFKEK